MAVAVSAFDIYVDMKMIDVCEYFSFLPLPLNFAHRQGEYSHAHFSLLKLFCVPFNLFVNMPRFTAWNLERARKRTKNKKNFCLFCR